MPNATETPDTAGLLELAGQAAKLAGAELLRRYGTISGLHHKSSRTDPVTDADKAAERILVDTITAGRPNDSMIGEEGTNRAGTSGLTWVVDPLDGTVNYLYQLDNWSVSVAVIDADGPLAGVVLDPSTDRLFSAVRGGGAFCNDTAIRVNDPIPMAAALVGTGFGYDADRRAVQGALVARILPRVRDIRRLGSAALDLCAVGTGALDAYYEEGIQHWDRAAGGLVVVEAGGLMGQYTPTGHTSGWLAAGPALDAEFRAAFPSS